MDIVFIGASRFGLRCLEMLHALDGVRVAGVLTAPSVFKAAHNITGANNVLHADMASFCEAHRIDCHILEGNMNDPAAHALVAAWKPQLIVVSGWYHIITPEWLALAPTYGLHGSLLPDYRGGAPLVWAMIHGETQTGISLFKMERGIDDGDIVGQAATPITPEDTIATLYARIENLGLGLLREHVPALLAGTASHTPQDHSKKRVFPLRSPADGEMDFSQNAAALYNFVRAQTRPYPGAFFMQNGQKISVWAAITADIKPAVANGETVFQENRLYVGCGEGEMLELLDVSVDEVPLALHDWAGRTR